MTRPDLGSGRTRPDPDLDHGRHRRPGGGCTTPYGGSPGPTTWPETCCGTGRSTPPERPSTSIWSPRRHCPRRPSLSPSRAVMAAGTGTDGLLVESSGWEADAIAIRAALAAIELADDSAQAAMDELERQGGTGVGGLAPDRDPGDVAAARGAAHPHGRQSPATRAACSPRWRGPRTGCSNIRPWSAPAFSGGGGLAERAARDGPADPQHVGRRPSPRRALRRRHPTHHGPSRPRHPVERHPTGQPAHPGPAPARGGRTVAGRPILRATARSGSQSYDAGSDHARHIVFLPGTDDLTTLPWEQDQDLRDSGTNFRNIGGLAHRLRARASSTR